MRRELLEARKRKGWSQAELGRRAGLPQAHVWSIEAGRKVPRVDTLLNLVRLLDHDLILVPQPLVPVVQSLVRDHGKPAGKNIEDEGESPLYELNEEAPERTP